MLLPRDDMDLDGAGAAHELVGKRAADQPPPEARARPAEHDLGHVLPPRQPQDLGRIVGALEPHRVAAEPLGETEGLGDLDLVLGVALLADALDIDSRPGGVEAGRELARPPHHPLGDLVRPDAGEQALGSAPGALDRLLPQIIDHLVVDPIGGAAERELPAARSDCRG